MDDDPEDDVMEGSIRRRPNSLEDRVLAKIAQGFKTCGRICAFYELADVFNKLLIGLCKPLVVQLEQVRHRARCVARTRDGRRRGSTVASDPARLQPRWGGRAGECRRPLNNGEMISSWHGVAARW